MMLNDIFFSQSLKVIHTFRKNTMTIIFMSVSDITLHMVHTRKGTWQIVKSSDVKKSKWLQIRRVTSLGDKIQTRIVESELF